MIPKNKFVGIIGIEYQFPKYKMKEEEMAKNIGWEVDKIKIGLGLNEIGVAGEHEDVVSLALSATSNLIKKFNINPNDVGRIEVGTESNFDGSKSIKTHLLELFPGNTSICGCDTTNACYGGVSALLNSISWLESSLCRGKYAIVVSTDIAMYKDIPAKPTSGAGAVAILLGFDPVFKFVPESLHHFSMNKGDFLKPKEMYPYPYIDGKKSIEIYLEAFIDLFTKFSKQEIPYQYIILHSPFPKLVRKACAKFAIPSDFFEDSLFISKQNGNSYTSSIFFSLISLCYFKKIKNGETICMFSFGSGCVSSIFCFKKVKEGCNIDDVEKRLNSRIEINYEGYEKLSNFNSPTPVEVDPDAKGYYLTSNINYFRTYKSNLNKN